MEKCKINIESRYVSNKCAVDIDRKFCEKLFSIANNLEQMNHTSTEEIDERFNGIKLALDETKNVFISGEKIILQNDNVFEIKYDPKNKLENMMLRRKEMDKLENEIKYYFAARYADQSAHK